MEAGLMTKYCWNECGIDENYIVESEAELMKNYCWKGSGIEKNNISEMEAEWWKSIAELEERLMKKYCGIAENIHVLLKHKRDRIGKNIAEMEAILMKQILLK